MISFKLSVQDWSNILYLDYKLKRAVYVDFSVQTRNELGSLWMGCIEGDIRETRFEDQIWYKEMGYDSIKCRVVLLVLLDYLQILDNLRDH